ncbi:hypothetical protein ACFO25_17445 [Paenactinomyces guangxiensis]|uniref:YjzC family protein n=1 Tax=Paenactinomyces guangxiensis TaxID=1490290 RepID=A0A7W2A910_9BACL|nr:hypothetical protein [Paenactinomyces guangxiensis]MBA4494749.1 hypothetical protein [Paenactinomyces guangxiensis]MBH8591833.1 hypothetical protein [Paenactinomyces guangxiensis]
MADRADAFKTGDRVREPGQYVSAAGERAEYQEGDTFKACPATGKETTWRQHDDGCGC